MGRASQAKQKLENEHIKESFHALKKFYSDALLERTSVHENEAREKLWIAYQVLGKVEQHFKEILEKLNLPDPNKVKKEKELDVFFKSSIPERLKRIAMDLQL